MARTARSETTPNARAKIFTNGRSQAVRLPREFRFEGKEVAIRKEGEAVVLEPVAKRKWPAGYWQRMTGARRTSIGAGPFRDARQLAAALGLTPADAVEMEVRSTLNDKIVEVVGRLAPTHAQVAKLSGTSRTRITAIMNRNTQDVSTDLLLRILARLGYRAKISFSKAA